MSTYLYTAAMSESKWELDFKIKKRQAEITEARVQAANPSMILSQRFEVLERLDSQALILRKQLLRFQRQLLLRMVKKAAWLGAKWSSRNGSAHWRLPCKRTRTASQIILQVQQGSRWQKTKVAAYLTTTAKPAASLKSTRITRRPDLNAMRISPTTGNANGQN